MKTQHPDSHVPEPVLYAMKFAPDTLGESRQAAEKHVANCAHCSVMKDGIQPREESHARLKRPANLQRGASSAAENAPLKRKGRSVQALVMILMIVAGLVVMAGAVLVGFDW